MTLPSKPRSLGYRTDLQILQGFGARIHEEQTHWVIQTPSNPGYHWGNFLLFRQPPGPGDFGRWMATFERAFAHAPEVTHRAFGWDGVEDDVGHASEFLSQGFELMPGVVLATDRPEPPPRPCPELEVRPLSGEADWEAALGNQVACRGQSHVKEVYEPFKRRQMADYRMLAASGQGAWFGAFLGNRLVGDLGLFVFEGLARYQSVGTHPDFRRRGVCTTLVYQAACLARERLGAQRFVIVTGKDSDPERVYRSVGFALREHTIGLSKS